MQDAADAQNGRVGYHTQQNHTGKLHLLDIVGGAGNQRCGGEFLDFGVGVADDGLEHIPAQVAANGGGNAGRDETDGDCYGHHQQRQGQHLAAGAQQIRHLYIVGNALGVVFQCYQQHSLAG